MNLYKLYGQEIISKLKTAIETQAQSVKKAADIIYKSQKNGHRLFVVGSGHSHMLAEEIFARAGGYVNITPILEPELMLHQHPMKSTLIERTSGYADILLELYNICADDVIIVVSNSGRNALPVEMALNGKKLGAKIIAITNIAHSSRIKSRHTSGKRLMDIADIVIDNCGDYGDAFFEINNFPFKMGATSTIIGSFIIQALIIELVNLFLQNGDKPDVFISSNLDGADERNKKLMSYCINKY